MQEIGIESTVLKSIVQGGKTVEARLGKPRFLKVRPGDKLKVREDTWEKGELTTSLPSSIVLVVRDILYFDSFRELFDGIEYTSLIPSAKTQAEAMARYREFYSDKDEEKYGVVALFFQVERSM